MRRANKSHKVPNVKLRPAPLPTRPARDHDPDASCDRSSDSEVPPNTSVVDFCPRPFKRFYICATGTMDKSALFKMAVDLGAESTSDFTDRVTHLIANSHGGAKYLCAVERKIPIMTPDWIVESHAVWLRGDDVDVEQSIAKYRLPIFSGVTLSLSGIEDIERRTEINRLVTANQGTYLRNLERPVKVTHLLCSGDTETDKMKYAEKFNKRKEAQIHLVWEEWFWDSLEFGGRFDERKYQVSRPRPERRKSVLENSTPPPHVQNSGPSFQPDSAIAVDDVNQSKRPRPVVPTGSFTVLNNFPIEGEEEEMAVVNKPVPAMTLQLWQSLLKPRGFELDSGKLIRSPSKSQTMSSSLPHLARSQAQPDAVSRNGTGVQNGKEKESVISSFRRANSFAPVPPNEPVVRQPFRRNTMCPLICPGEAEGSSSRDPVLPEESPMCALFASCTFRLLGEARCSNVRLAIEKGGGVVMDDDIEQPNFIIVRLISGSKLYRDEFDDSARTKYRTECWLEHSVFHERICKADENITFTPLRISTPVPDAENIYLSLSGLDQSQLCWIRRLVRAVGATLEPTFSRRSSHLICPCGTGAKYEKALEWQIPVVSLAWLEDIAKTGSIPPVDEYLVGGSRIGASTNRQDSFGHSWLLDAVPEVRKDKGKGKEKEVDSQMMDITNDHSADQPMFVKNTALLQDTIPQHREPDARRPHSRFLETKSPSQIGLFGKPILLRHESDSPAQANAHVRTVSSSPPGLPPPSSSPAAAEAELPLPIFSPPRRVPPARPPSRPTRQSSGVQDDIRTRIRTHTPSQTRTDLQTPLQTQPRIPSSTSPSPMKLPPSSSMPDAFVSSSSQAAHSLDTDAITKALHESLTSLLGKRPMEEDEAAREISLKKGKRVRPGGQSNIASRDASRESLISPTRLVVRPPVPLPLPPPPDVSTNMGLFDGLGTMGGGPRSTEESLRVTYEDPGQAEERRRLLRMLGGGDPDEAEGAGMGEDKVTSANAGRAKRTRRLKGP